MKSLYKHKHSGDIFAIETDEAGTVIATCGPLFGDGFDPKTLDYDQYWNTEIRAKLADFERIETDAYKDLLAKWGFYPQSTQPWLFG